MTLDDSGLNGSIVGAWVRNTSEHTVRRIANWRLFFKKKMKFLVSMTTWMEQDTDTLMLVISNDWTTFPV